MEPTLPIRFTFFQLHRAFFECMRISMKGKNIRPHQGPLLIMLSKHEGISQADIMRKMDVSAATVAVSIARLEKLGLVVRKKNPDNHRAYIVSLTDKGRQEANELYAVMKEVSHVVRKGFSEQEIQAMDGYMERALLNLEQHYQSKEGQNSDA